MSEFVLLVVDDKQVKCDLASLKKIGEGGEGAIYAIERDIYTNSNLQCIKILTNPDAEKIAVITHAAKTSRHVWQTLDGYATTPLFLVYDETGKQVRGYGMHRLGGWRNLGNIGDIMTKGGAKRAGVGMKETAQIFLDLQRAVALAHKQGFIIGDFNSSNVLFRKELFQLLPSPSWGREYKVTLIDTDSWSINRPDLGLVYFPGIVDKMELYHPDYLRADLEGNAHPQANESHDWWAFSYLLWKALTKHDPFTGGEIHGETTKSRLANIMAGIDSQLDFDTDPEIALSTLRLGPVMQNTLNRFLTLKFQRAFPALLIEQFIGEICTCPQCEEEMSRSAVFCPGCLNKIPD